jgi:hypothetical protein
MNQDEIIQLAIRQVKNIQEKAEKIVNGKRSDEAIESFAKDSTALVSFIDANIPSEEIRKYLKELPLVDYKPKFTSFWQYLFSPSWWIVLYKEYNSKNKIIEAIRDAQNKFVNLELLLKGLTG